MSDALRLAHELILAMRDTDEEHWDTLEEAAAELRRLHAALAEPEQEPVRLQCTTCGTVYANGVPPQVPEHKPQTTHWEGCEAVHPECKEKNT